MDKVISSDIILREPKDAPEGRGYRNSIRIILDTLIKVFIVCVPVVVLFLAPPFFLFALPVTGGLAWALIGAVVCALISTRGRRKAALAGAVCSTLLFFPWVYLNLRLRGTKVGVGLIGNAYIILFIAWMITSIFFAIAVFARIGELTENLSSYPEATRLWLLEYSLWCIAGAGCIGTGMMAIYTLKSKFRESGLFSTHGQPGLALWGMQLTGPDRDGGATVELWPYLRPWALLMLWLEVAGGLFLLSLIVHTHITGFAPF